MCNTLAYAHDRDIIHRDLKPDNILIEETGAVYVIDWGLAKSCAGPGPWSTTVTGAVMGSPGYMSPEQARGDSNSAGPEADVFALGAILYEILAGHSPFQKSTGRESLLSAIYSDAKDPRRTNPWVSRSLAAICRKALEKEPSNRYKNAGGLLSDIRAYLDGKPVSVCRQSLREWSLNATKRNPTRAAVVFGMFLVALSLGAFIGVQFFLDGQLARKAYNAVAEINSNKQDILASIGQIDEAVATARGSELDQLRLSRDLNEMKLLFHNIEAFMLLRDVAKLRFSNAQPETIADAKTIIRETAERGLEAGHPELTYALLSRVLDGDREKGALPLSDQEFKQLEDLRAAALAASAESRAR